MKRSAIKRKSELRRGPGPKRKTRLKAVNRKRRAKRAEEGKVYGPYHRRISALPCYYAGPDCWGIVKGHHVKTVAAGGEDYANEVPLCVWHHAAAHNGHLRKDELAVIALECAEKLGHA